MRDPAGGALLVDVGLAAPLEASASYRRTVECFVAEPRQCHDFCRTPPENLSRAAGVGCAQPVTHPGSLLQVESLEKPEHLRAAVAAGQPVEEVHGASIRGKLFPASGSAVDPSVSSLGAI
jgi:hypothetical protein